VHIGRAYPFLVKYVYQTNKFASKGDFFMDYAALFAPIFDAARPFIIFAFISGVLGDFAVKKIRKFRFL
jgi:hypothetical protein